MNPNYGWQKDKTFKWHNIVVDPITLRDRDLRGLTLNGADLRHIDLCYKNLEGTNFIDTNLFEVNFTFAKLMNTNFTNANLVSANLMNANLTKSRLKYANLMNANLMHANLEYADLTHADLKNTNLINTNMNHTILEDGQYNLSDLDLCMHLDRKLVVQRLFHLLANVKYSNNISKEYKAKLLTPNLINLANEYHDSHIYNLSGIDENLSTEAINEIRAIYDASCDNDEIDSDAKQEKMYNEIKGNIHKEKFNIITEGE